MLTDHNLVAVYGQPIPDVNLAVRSRNPDSDVLISLAPADLNTEASGSTAFDRVYPYGTQIIATAPLEAGGNSFSFWELNGGAFSTERSLTLELYEDTEITAVYGEALPDVVTLTVSSLDPDSGVPITVSVEDINFDQNGTTTFTRDYNTETEVTLTAPTYVGGDREFDHWELNGVYYLPDNSITLTLLDDTEVTAVYKEGEPSVSEL